MSVKVPQRYKYMNVCVHVSVFSTFPLLAAHIMLKKHELL